MTLICALFFVLLLLLTPCSPLADERGQAALAARPVPLSEAFNVSGKFQEPKQR